MTIVKTKELGESKFGTSLLVQPFALREHIKLFLTRLLILTIQEREHEHQQLWLTYRLSIVRMNWNTNVKVNVAWGFHTIHSH